MLTTKASARKTAPTLKLVRCHRGREAGAIRTAISVYPEHYRAIPSGNLKGCMHRTVGSNQRSIYQLKRGYVLEFVCVIRVRL